MQKKGQVDIGYELGVLKQMIPEVPKGSGGFLEEVETFGIKVGEGQGSGEVLSKDAELECSCSAEESNLNRSWGARTRCAQPRWKDSRHFPLNCWISVIFKVSCPSVRDCTAKGYRTK